MAMGAMACVTGPMSAMGYSMVWGPKGEGLACLHPNDWYLKQGAPVKLPASQHAGYVCAIITGASSLCSMVPFLGCAVVEC